MHVVSFSSIFVRESSRTGNLRLPKSIALVEASEVIRRRGPLPVADMEARLSLPRVHEAAKLAGGRQPDHGVDVIGHDDEPDAASGESDQLVVQDAQQNSLVMIMVEQSTTTIDGERDEMA